MDKELWEIMYLIKLYKYIIVAKNKYLLIYCIYLMFSLIYIYENIVSATQCDNCYFSYNSNKLRQDVPLRERGSVSNNTFIVLAFFNGVNTMQYTELSFGYENFELLKNEYQKLLNQNQAYSKVIKLLTELVPLDAMHNVLNTVTVNDDGDITREAGNA